MNLADIPNIEAMLQLWMLGMIRPGAAFLAAPASALRQWSIR